MQLTLSSDSFYVQQLLAAQTHDEHKPSMPFKHVTVDMFSHFSHTLHLHKRAAKKIGWISLYLLRGLMEAPEVGSVLWVGGSGLVAFVELYPE